AAGNTVIPINTATNKAGPAIKVGNCPTKRPSPDCGLTAIAITPDGKTAYVVNETTKGTVTPIDTATNKPGTPIKVGDHPDGVVITPDGKTAYVLNLSSASITPVDVASNKA